MNDVKNLTRQQAIDEMCRQCVYAMYTETRAWRRMSENCDAKCSCSLWPFRPTTKDKNNEK